jgi:hypothetical protein
MVAKTTAGPIPSARSTKTPTNYDCPTISDNDDHPSLSDLPKSTLLANAYSEYLDPLNVKECAIVS